jgi:hypothetical protein
MSKIIESSGRISFETDSGYSSQEDWPPMPGAEGLLVVIDEIGRVLTINGDADKARETLEAAIKRTLADLAA